jgi:HEAT repeat protein
MSPDTRTQRLSDAQRERIPALIKDLGNRDGRTRQTARIALVEMGRLAVDFLAELIEHPRHIYRWECLKTLVQIADPNATELFLLALEDEDFDVRWLAAEGLIKLGPKSTLPLLEYLMANVKKGIVRDGAHHVLKALRRRSTAKTEYDALLHALKHGGSTGSVSTQAYDLFRRLQAGTRK